MPAQFAFQSVQLRLVEYPPFGEADLVQAVQQVFSFDILVAADFNAAYRRPFLENYNQDVSVPLELHIIEKTRLEQGAYRFRRHFGGEIVTHFKRQVVEYGSGGEALQSLHPNVLNNEFLRRKPVSHGGEQQRRQYRFAIVCC